MSQQNLNEKESEASAEKPQSAVQQYVSPEKLRIGLYVHIDLPWFRHPFTLNNFKIKTEEQIRELRALKQFRFRYDPERSDPEALPDAPAPEPPPPLEAVAQASLSDDPAQAEKQARMQQAKEFRERVDHVEKAFVKAAAVMRNINRNLTSRPKETLEEVEGMVGQMVTAFLEHPEVALHVMSEKCGGEEVYYHSLNVTILAMMLAKSLGLSFEQGQLLGTGALLHDVGLMEIPDRVLKKPPEEYTRAERELRATHVEQGVKLAKKIGLPGEVLAVIAQHHEMADGAGYPGGVKLERMTPLARVVALVNFYDNLCNPLDVALAMTPHDALSFMFAQRRAKFDPKMLQMMIRCLGVYPPGSVVKLSDESLGLVVSVNPQKPLRPWVLLYDPKVPKEEAMVIDLEQRAEVQIVKALRPALLPPAVNAYLNPRKRVTYFFDGKASKSGGGA